MRGIAIEDFSMSHWQVVKHWLIENYGESSIKSWYVDIQPGFEDLIMNDEIYTVFLMKWS